MADKDHDPFTNEFDSFVNKTLEDHLAPGLAIAIVHGDKTFARGYGVANLETKEPITPHTLFYTASTTKSFTAATASKLVCSDESRYKDITWSTKLADLIREDFALQDEWTTNHVTLTDALSHRTGMPRHDLIWQLGDPSVRDQTRALRHLPLHDEIRTKWEYCNVMYSAVSHALETVTNTPMDELLKECIWDPLGMEETFYSTSDALAYAEKTEGVKVATGYIYDKSTASHSPVPFDQLPPANGAGGMMSNVLDYTRWIKMFLQPTNPSNPIAPEAIKDMTDRIIPAPSGSSPVSHQSYGLGLTNSLFHGHELVGHGGDINGYQTLMAWLPEKECGVVIMQNSYSLAAQIVYWRILEDLLSVPEKERFDTVGQGREREEEMERKLRNARRELYPEAGNTAATPPALPLQAYEGTYMHAAYQGLKVSMSATDGQETDALPGAALSLVATPAQKSYLMLAATFHHISCEHWYAHMRKGPGGYLDSLHKTRFEVGVDGKVKGLWLQAEPAVEDLAWFEKGK